MKGFILSFRSEFYKSRKTMGFWFAILLPTILVGGIFLYFLLHSTDMAKTPGIVLWTAYSSIISGLMGNLLLPFFIIFVAYSVNNMEHKADTWKTLFTLPISKWSVYAAKYFYAMFLVFLCLFLFYALLLGTGNLLGLLKTDLHFYDYSMAYYLGELYIKLFLVALGILSIQFLLSLVWSDFLKPMGIGFLGIIAEIVGFLVKWENIYLLPYASPALALNGLSKATRTIKGKTGAMPHFTIDIFTREVWVSLTFAVVVFVAGFFIVQKKSVQ